MANPNQVTRIVRPLTINEVALSIATMGPERTILVQSEPGCGKTTILKMQAEMVGDKWRKPRQHCPNDKRHYVYIDATCTDLGDLFMRAPGLLQTDPRLAFLNEENAKKLSSKEATHILVQYLTDLIPQDGKPLVIMIDEHMKAPTKMLKQALTRLVLERCLGDWPLPEGSIVFSTSNNESDMLGDNLPAHSLNRVILCPMAKPDIDTWLAWAVRNGIDPLVMAAAKMNLRWTKSYLDDGQAENTEIFNPSRPNQQFVSPRSLHAASDVVKKRKILPTHVIATLLAGTIGQQAAGHLTAVMVLENEVHDIADILRNPDTIAVPTKVAATFLMMFNALEALKTSDDMTNFLTFIERCGSNDLFATFHHMAFRSANTVKLAKGNRKMADWAMKNAPMLIG